MRLKLVKPSLEHKKAIIEMLEEWTEYNKNHPEENTSPYAIFRYDYHDFDHYIASIDNKAPKNGLVPDTTFFCLDEERNIMVGAINIRHYLNEYLLNYGGHIGDGIRPIERRKGYATEMIRLSLDFCRQLGLDKILLVCDKDNIGSAKSIINNGGILENEIIENGRVEQRYWITIK